MSIRALNIYVDSPRIAVSVLTNKSLAIDGFWFIKKYLPSLGIDFVLDPTVFFTTFLQPLIDLSKNTQIVFVWDGLKHKPALHATKAELSSKIFNSLYYGTANRQHDEEFTVGIVTAILRANSIRVIRAPYSAAAQCVYFLKTNCVNYIFTKNDAILFDGSSKIIVDLNLKLGKIDVLEREYVEKGFIDMITKEYKHIQESGGENIVIPTYSTLKHSFKYFAIASGCDFCPTIPLLANDFTCEALISLFCDREEFERQLEQDQEYYKQYSNALLGIKYHPVMTLNGMVGNAITNESSSYFDGKSPSDLYKVFGQRLPDILYELLYRCEVSPITLNDFCTATNPTCSKAASPNSSYVVEHGQGQSNLVKDIHHAIVSIVQNSTTATSETFVSEIIKGILMVNYTHNPRINKLVEILFIKLMQNKALDREELTNLLNAGVETGRESKTNECAADDGKARSTSKCEAADAVNNTLPERPINYADILNYHISNDAVIALSDLANVIASTHQCKNDIGFSLNVKKLLKKIDNETVHSFLQSNLHKNGEMAEFL